MEGEDGTETAEMMELATTVEDSDAPASLAGCCKCACLEQMIVVLTTDLRARDQLILSRVSSVEDQLGNLLSSISACGGV